MKVKKLIIGMIVALFFSIPVSTSASTNVRNGQNSGAPSKLDVLVLVLPDASVNNYGYTGFTTMHYPEIQKITEVAKQLESWSTHNLYINVDVKVDYEDIKSLTFYKGWYWALQPGNIEKQIANASTMDQYDSIVAVYRSVDNQGQNIMNAVECPLGRKGSSNNATFSSLLLKDGDHSLSQFSIDYPEQLLMKEVLSSVYEDMKTKLPELESPENYFDASNAKLSKYKMMDYMNGVSNKTMSNHWSKFVK